MKDETADVLVASEGHRSFLVGVGAGFQISGLEISDDKSVISGVFEAF